MRAELITDEAGLESVRGAWDALAVRAGSPFGAPAWAEAWWRNLAPENARLAVVAVRDGDHLAGLAPFFTTSRFGITEARLLSGGWASRLGILCEEGREDAVAAAISSTLAEASPVPDIVHWEAIDATSRWPERLSESWPGRAHRLRDESRRGAPVLRLAPATYVDWFAAKGSHFRGHMRRDRRKIEKEGATFRAATEETLEADLSSFARLHSARREERGGSTAVSPESMAALTQAAGNLFRESRFAVWLIDDPEGEAISAQVFVRAGSVVAFWNTGFDERWRRFSPGALTVLVAIEDAFSRGDRLMDLGGGEAAYKDRLSDEDRPVVWRTSYRRGPRYPLAWLRRLPGQLARRGAGILRERLGAERLGRLRSRIGSLARGPRVRHVGVSRRAERGRG